MRIATWNVNSLKARLPRVEAWLDEVAARRAVHAGDQARRRRLPALTFQALGYDAVHHGEGRWNGVAILSRVGLDDAAPPASRGDDAVPDDEARLVSATCGGVRVVSVYVPNGRSLDHEQYQFKLDWLGAASERTSTPRCDPAADVVVCGDFNIAPDDRDVYDPDRGSRRDPRQPAGARRARRRSRPGAWSTSSAGTTTTTGLYSWWDYRAGNFHKHLGMRIDLVLATKPLAERSTWALIDRNARKGKLPSDHAPLVVDFDSRLHRDRRRDDR